MKGVLLWMQLESLPDSKQQKSPIVVVRGLLRCCILQLVTAKDGNEETLFAETDIGVSLFGFFWSRTFLLLRRELLQFLSIGTTHFYIRITLLNNAKNIPIKAEYHHSFERRKYLILHVCHACLLTRETEAIERKHVALVEVLERNDGGGTFDDKLDTLEAIVHQVRFLQGLPQDISGDSLLCYGKAVSLYC